VALSCLLFLYEDHKISKTVNKMVSKTGHCRQRNMILNLISQEFFLHELCFEFLNCSKDKLIQS